MEDTLTTKTELLMFFDEKDLVTATKRSTSLRKAPAIATIITAEEIRNMGARNLLDVLKMDIEGAECQALEGARQTIAQCHPRLAICVYHNVGDFYRIPRLVLSIRSDYDIYLRHKRT